MRRLFGDSSRGARSLIRLSREHCRPVYAEALQIDRRVTNKLNERFPADLKSAHEPMRKAILTQTVLLNHWQRHSLDLNRTSSESDHSWSYKAGVWTRRTLRILASHGNTGGDPPLLITPCTNTCQRLWAAISIARNHPQVVVRCSYQLAQWSIILGIAGLLFSAFSAGITLKDPNSRPYGLFHLLLLALATPVYLMCFLSLWLGLVIFPICVVIRWCRRD